MGFSQQAGLEHRGAGRQGRAVNIDHEANPAGPSVTPRGTWMNGAGSRRGHRSWDRRPLGSPPQFR